MIEPVVTIAFTPCCDRCGTRLLEAVADTVHAATAHASEAGWIVSNWLHEGKCARHTVFCPACTEQLAKENKG